MNYCILNLITLLIFFYIFINLKCLTKCEQMMYNLMLSIIRSKTLEEQSFIWNTIGWEFLP